MAKKEKKEKKGKGFFKEFKEFISRGNVLDMAVGIIIGGAFTAIVTALCNNVLKPIINWILAALLGLCAFKTLTLGPLANAKGFIMKLLSGSIFPLWFFPAGFRRVLELLPFMNIYQLPLGIYIGQYSMEEILLRTALQMVWCGALWLLFDILQKKASAVVLIQGG